MVNIRVGPAAVVLDEANAFGGNEACAGDDWFSALGSGARFRGFRAPGAGIGVAEDGIGM